MADTSCPNCGGSPMGEGCYHICHNSTHYYSPEQERYDDQFYGDDDMRERYAATAEPSQYEDNSCACGAGCTDGVCTEQELGEYAVAAWPNTTSIDPDDIPF